MIKAQVELHKRLICLKFLRSFCKERLSQLCPTANCNPKEYKSLVEEYQYLTELYYAAMLKLKGYEFEYENRILYLTDSSLFSLDKHNGKSIRIGHKEDLVTTC